MLPELTEFVPATRMGIVRKVLLGLENRAGCIFSLLLNAFEWIVNVNKQLKKGSTRVFFYFDKTTEQVAIIQLVTILALF
jgi:hypothetical protein